MHINGKLCTYHELMILLVVGPKSYLIVQLLHVRCARSGSVLDRKFFSAVLGRSGALVTARRRQHAFPRGGMPLSTGVQQYEF